MYDFIHLFSQRQHKLYTIVPMLRASLAESSLLLCTQNNRTPSQTTSVRKQFDSHTNEGG